MTSSIRERLLQGVMAALALMVTTMATNRSCMWYLGQDKMPEDSKKLRRF